MTIIRLIGSVGSRKLTGWIALHGVIHPLAIVGVEFPLFGYRYWIVVTNMAYPLQTNPGVVTYFYGSVLSGSDTLGAAKNR
ncbi:MAG: hypothetical protein V8S95_06450 [Odoribacter sp.]